ncbi:MAG: hypothetical protein MHM6MM_006743 [Cercozoa sp. M6MM]
MESTLRTLWVRSDSSWRQEQCVLQGRYLFFNDPNVNEVKRVDLNGAFVGRTSCSLRPCAAFCANGDTPAYAPEWERSFPCRECQEIGGERRFVLETVDEWMQLAANTDVERERWLSLLSTGTATHVQEEDEWDLLDNASNSNSGSADDNGLPNNDTDNGAIASANGTDANAAPNNGDIGANDVSSDVDEDYVNHDDANKDDSVVSPLNKSAPDDSFSVAAVRPREPSVVPADKTTPKRRSSCYSTQHAHYSDINTHVAIRVSLNWRARMLRRWQSSWRLMQSDSNSVNNGNNSASGSDTDDDDYTLMRHPSSMHLHTEGSPKAQQRKNLSSLSLLSGVSGTSDRPEMTRKNLSSLSLLSDHAGAHERRRGDLFRSHSTQDTLDTDDDDFALAYRNTSDLFDIDELEDDDDDACAVVVHSSTRAARPERRRRASTVDLSNPKQLKFALRQGIPLGARLKIWAQCLHVPSESLWTRAKRRTFGDCPEEEQAYPEAFIAPFAPTGVALHEAREIRSVTCVLADHVPTLQWCPPLVLMARLMHETLLLSHASSESPTATVVDTRGDIFAFLHAFVMREVLPVGACEWATLVHATASLVFNLFPRVTCHLENECGVHMPSLCEVLLHELGGLSLDARYKVRLLDVLFNEGKKALLRVLLALFDVREAALLQCDTALDVFAVMTRTPLASIEENERVFEVAFRLPLSRAHIAELVAHYTKLSDRGRLPCARVPPRVARWPVLPRLPAYLQTRTVREVLQHALLQHGDWCDADLHHVFGTASDGRTIQLAWRRMRAHRPAYISLICPLCVCVCVCVCVCLCVLHLRCVYSAIMMTLRDTSYPRSERVFGLVVCVAHSTHKHPHAHLPPPLPRQCSKLPRVAEVDTNAFVFSVRQASQEPPSLSPSLLPSSRRTPSISESSGFPAHVQAEFFGAIDGSEETVRQNALTVHLSAQTGTLSVAASDGSTVLRVDTLSGVARAVATLGMRRALAPQTALSQEINSGHFDVVDLDIFVLE